MARQRRVSVRGRGADLFFGDLPTDATEERDDGASEAIQDAEISTADERSGEPPRDHLAPEHGSMHARTEDAREPQSRELISGDILNAIWREVNKQATVTNAFRYTHDELEQLSDAIYQLGKEHGVRVTKQEVARLGLNAVLADYQIRGAQSLLSEFIARRKHPGR